MATACFIGKTSRSANRVGRLPQAPDPPRLPLVTAAESTRCKLMSRVGPLADLDHLTPAQIEGAATRLRDIRRRSEAMAELESRTKREHNARSVAARSHRRGAEPASRSSDTDAAGACGRGRAAPALPFAASIARTCSCPRYATCSARTGRDRCASLLAARAR